MQPAGVGIRDATDNDVAAITAIYAHHVLRGTGTFETVPPDADEMRRRMAASVDAGLPFLVAVEAERPCGFAYAATYRPRPAYEFTAEDSFYLDPLAIGRGIGTALLRAVIARCEQRGLRQLIAVIGDSANIASIKAHERCGFARVGVFRDVGWKFDRWIDTVLMQRALDPGR